MPDLVAELAHPRLVLRVLGPAIGERRLEQERRIDPTRIAPRLHRVAPATDVVPRDPVGTREGAGADRRVRCGRYRGERAGDGVSIRGALGHQTLQVGPR